ncbi:MAG: aminotransferase class V-fold PLP-dependent enzyme, partial [Bacteroidota bacterium]
MQDLIQKLEQTLELIKAFLELEKEQPVTPYASPQELKDQLDLEIGQRGIDNDTFFAILKEVMVATPKTASDSFFNQLFGGRNTPALVGEILASVLNNSMYTFKVAGPHVLIEKEVIAKMLEKVDYRNGTGTLTPGGSVSNMIAMMVARNEKDTQVRNAGLGGQKMIAYTSEEGHYSTRKNAGILGLGRDQVRMIKSDALGKMDVQDLEENIQADLELGHIPFFINSTAGTTVLGAFDPFEEIALIAQKYQAWFHIDGALGGTVVLSRKYRHLVKRIKSTQYGGAGRAIDKEGDMA